MRQTDELTITSVVEKIKTLGEEEREAVFEKAFIESDEAPLSLAEKQAVYRAEKELDTGETIEWKPGK